MVTAQKSWSVDLPAEFGHADVSDKITELVRDSGVTTGIVTVGLVGSTGAVTTIEYEPGALADLHRALASVAPREVDYKHDARWGDGNGFSHVRSAMLKTSISVPVVNGMLQLGTWQQIIVLNLDNRDRNRQIVAVVVGE